MAKKKAADTVFPRRQKIVADSWAAVGIDTSLSSIAVCGIGYDAKLKKMSKVLWRTVRWNNDTHTYFDRLLGASKAHELVLDVMHDMWVIDPANVHIAIEEPFPLGIIKKLESAYIKQQCEISGAVKASLVRFGFQDIAEINNAKWKAVLRADGVLFPTAPRGASASVKAAAKLQGKMEVKQWAMDTYGLPDLPDLVQGEHGKIPRPEKGKGANAKALQPEDVYDACACMEWMRLDVDLTS